MEKFEQAFQRGLSGRVESFDIWLKNQGIDPLRFDYEEVTRHILENRIILGRERELESIAEFIGFFAKERKGCFHLPVIGAHGSGKTNLLSITESFFQGLKTNLKLKALDAKLFSSKEELEDEDERESEQLLFKYLDEVKQEKYNLLIVDSCEEDRNIDYSLKLLVKAIGDGVMVTSWEPQFWSLYREKISEFLPISKEIFLEPLGKDEMRYLLTEVTDFLSGSKVKLPEEVTRAIHELSQGIPRLAIELLFRSFNEAFLQRKEAIDVDSVNRAAKAMALLGLSEKLVSLSEQQITVLKQILLSHDPRGLRPTELVEILNKDKATVSYHLNILASNGLVFKQRIGRSLFYQIKDELKPLIQLKISREGDFLA